MSAEKCALEKERVSKRELTFSLQWHVTAKCDQKCKHCYMYDSPFYTSEVKNELTFEECKSIIDDYVQTINRWKVKGTIFFSGGDPLLRKDFFEILKYTKNKGVNQIGVMGNSYHLDELTAQKLKKCGVSAYQISLDGLKDTHDFFRKPGSFVDSLRGYQDYKGEGLIVCGCFCWH